MGRIRRGIPEKPDAFDLPIEKRFADIGLKIKGIEEELVAVRNDLPTEVAMLALIHKASKDEYDRLETLRDDVVRLLGFLVAQGTLDQDALNEALAPRG